MSVAVRSIDQLSETQVQILRAAEKLFATNGIDGASMREIAARANQRNPFAVQYHFGSREGLVRSLWCYRMEQMELPRAKLLEHAEVVGKASDPRTIMEMIYLPQVELVSGDGGRAYASFLCQYLLRLPAVHYGDFGAPLPPVLSKILGLLRGCLPKMSDAAAQRRLVSSSLVFLHFLSIFGDPDDEGGGPESFEFRLNDTLAQIEKATFLPIADPQ